MRPIAAIVADIEAAHAAMARALAELVLAHGRAVDLGPVPASIVRLPSLDTAPPVVVPKPEVPRFMALARPPRSVKQWKLNGVPTTIADMARAAGVSHATMFARLKGGMTPEDAIAFGKVDRHRARPHGRDADHHPNAKLHAYQGRQLRCDELAELAGCSRNTMKQRLRTHDAEQAVAMGASDRSANSKLREVLKRKQPKPEPAPATLPPRSVFEYRKPALPPPQCSPRVIEPGSKLDALKGPVLREQDDVVIPPGVKRTVAEPKPDTRFTATGPVPSVFGRIGHYDSTGSAIERALRERQR